MKFSLKKLEKATLVGVASLALIIPLGMNSGTTASAHGKYYYDGANDELIYNGFTNANGDWIGSKRDQWLFDHGYIETDGDPTYVNDTLNDEVGNDINSPYLTAIYKNAMRKQRIKRYDALHHIKYTPRKPHKKNAKRGRKGRKPRTRKGKRVARKGIKRNRKRTVKPRKARKPKKRRTAKRQPKPKKPATKQGKRKWITYHLPSKQKGSKQGKQQPRKWITYHFK